MNKHRVLSILSFICLAAFSFFLEACQQTDIDSKLRKEHPRLIFTMESQQRISTLASEDTLLQQSIETLVRLANQMVSQPTIRYNMDGLDLLSKSRDCLSKVMTLSLSGLPAHR